jgi:hypothetical protein
MLGASREVRWPLETGVVLLRMLAVYAGALCPVGARSNVSASFFSLQFLAKIGTFSWSLF